MKTKIFIFLTRIASFTKVSILSDYENIIQSATFLKLDFKALFSVTIKFRLSRKNSRDNHNNSDENFAMEIVC